MCACVCVCLCLTWEILLRTTIKQDSALSFPLIKLGDDGNFSVGFMLSMSLYLTRYVTISLPHFHLLPI